MSLSFSLSVPVSFPPFLPHCACSSFLACNDCYNLIHNLQKTVNISDGVDGSTLSYTINYTDSGTGKVCHTTIILASSCQNGVCEHQAKAMYFKCSTSTRIGVTVSATNVLGAGQPSIPVTLGSCQGTA